MKFIKILLQLILMILCFLFGMKFSEIKKTNENKNEIQILEEEPIDTSIVDTENNNLNLPEEINNLNLDNTDNSSNSEQQEINNDNINANDIVDTAIENGDNAGLDKIENLNKELEDSINNGVDAITNVNNDTNINNNIN